MLTIMLLLMTTERLPRRQSIFYITDNLLVAKSVSSMRNNESFRNFV